MTARPRMVGESFENYRKRLNLEEKALRERLKGRWFHVSQQYVQVPDGEGGYEMKVQGVTYVKEKKDADN